MGIGAVGRGKEAELFRAVQCVVIVAEDQARILVQRAAMTGSVKDETVIAALQRLATSPEGEFLARSIPAASGLFLLKTIPITHARRHLSRNGCPLARGNRTS